MSNIKQYYIKLLYNIKAQNIEHCSSNCLTDLHMPFYQPAIFAYFVLFILLCDFVVGIYCAFLGSRRGAGEK